MCGAQNDGRDSPFDAHPAVEHGAGGAPDGIAELQAASEAPPSALIDDLQKLTKARAVPWLFSTQQRPCSAPAAHSRPAPSAQAQLMQQLADRGMAAGATALRKPDLVLRLAPALQAEARRDGRPGRDGEAGGGGEQGADVGAPRTK